MIIRILKAAFTCPAFILTILAGISVFALAFALISQYGFGLYPCEFCLYQRIPYIIVIVLGIFGILATKMMGPKYGAFNIALCSLAFFINSGIAFYHVGIEKGWWSAGCSTPDFSKLTPDQIGEAIRNAPTARCDDVPWELFSISMAGYNVILCFILGIYALITSIKIMRASHEK
jgi:disulfide bond formation protein DsbB